MTNRVPQATNTICQDFLLKNSAVSLAESRQHRRRCDHVHGLTLQDVASPPEVPPGRLDRCALRRLHSVRATGGLAVLDAKADEVDV